MPQKKRDTKRKSRKVRKSKVNFKGQRGDYGPSATPWRDYGTKIGSAAGGILGKGFLNNSEMGSTIGGKIGGLAHYIGKLFGSGDYKIGSPPSTNSLFQGSEKLPYDPTITFGEKSVRIKHREYLSDVITSPTASTFQVINYNFNPGLANTFPWLSQIAPSFQTYRWHGAVVEFKSTSADALNSVNTALGSVVLATDYNAQTINEAFVSKQEMLNYMGSIDCKPSDCALMGIECDPKQMALERLYIRTGVDSANSDLRMSDMCSFALATSGFQGTSVIIGELYIVYDVELFMPKDYILGSLNLFNRGTFQITSLTNQVQNILISGLFGANGTMSAINSNILFSNDNSTNSAHAYINISDHTFLQNGMILQFEYQIDSLSATATLGVPNTVQSGGTLVETTNSFKNPNIVITGYTVSVIYRIKITDVNLLNTPTGGAYTLALGYPNARRVFAFANTGVTSASNSVPAFVSQARYVISVVNTKQTLN